jgi:hypothetical protein
MGSWIGIVLPAALMLQGGQATVTKDDFRTQPPTLTERQLRDQFWSIFEKPDERRERPARRPLDSVWLTTRPYPTEVPGLCRQDSVVLHFAQAERMPDIVDAQTPVRAYGFDSSASFRFLRPPERSYSDQLLDRREKRDFWTGACTRIAKDDAEWLSAPDAQTAVDGWRAGMSAAAALAAGKIKVSNCGRSENGTAVACSDVVSYFAHGRPGSIERCDASYGVACFKLWGIDDTETRITVAAYGEGGVPPGIVKVPDGTILSIDVEFYITVADERAD